MLTVLCPSRGRPDAAAEVMKTFLDTVTDLDTRLVFVVDPDDLTQIDYPESLTDPIVQTCILPRKPQRSGMLGALNAALTYHWILPSTASVVGFVGDDHRFRTPGWDAAILDYLEEHPGVAYADDMSRGVSLATQWFVSRRIVDAFGMGLPTLRHLYIDDYWMKFAGAAECLYYLPDIQIEHMHPTVGKGEWDDSYRANNSGAMYQADAQALYDWTVTNMDADVETLKKLVAKR